MLLSSFADREVWDVPQKQVVVCDELSRQSRFYRPSSSRLLQVAVQQNLSGVDIDDATGHFLGTDDGGVGQARRSDRHGRRVHGCVTDARLTDLLAEQARDDFCKQVAAELENQPDGQLNEGSGQLNLRFSRNMTDMPGVLVMRARARTHIQGEEFHPVRAPAGPRAGGRWRSRLVAARNGRT